ncbi:MAG: hypothetical protein JOZ18_14025 [Chloroflexi bacterium]|nr:hypothetical protein [Chloroflexota bacterium]
MHTRPLDKHLSILWISLLLLVLLSACGGTPATPDMGEKSANVPMPTPPIVPTPTSPPVPICNQPVCLTPSSVPGGRQLIDTWGNAHLFQAFDYAYSPADIVAQAKSYDFVWGVTPSNVQYFRSGNPNIFLSYYFPMNRDAGTFLSADVGRSHTLAYWKYYHPDWILYKCDRVTPVRQFLDPNLSLDVTNPAVLAWQVQNFMVPASQSGYDALAADNLNLENLFGACGVYRNGQWVQLYSGSVSDPQWRADMLNWIVKTQAALHAIKPHPLALVINLGLPDNVNTDPSMPAYIQQIINHVDGVLYEAGYTHYGSGYLTDNDWLQLVQLCKSVQQQHKPFYINDEFDDNATLIKNDHLVWALSTYLMSKDHLSALFASSKQNYGADRRRDEYFVKIGYPKDDMRQDQNVYWRDYTGGEVIVNPSSTATYSITLNSGQYVDLFGKPVSQSFLIQPHTGMVLLNH